ncbi:Glycosyl hydrolases family 28 [Rhizoctonia solani]|uniref:endo-polygalacturonase n=1 Tax=Rhizoctonia solani TaxID=456999 RepID=A0A8H7I3V9_9AGAM|nr:Glycosyl hydrolases family 28 [Rhizoctonia solani]
MRFSLALATLPVALVAAVPTGKRCTGTISSLNDAAPQKCTTININAFTVPAGKTFAILLSMARPSTCWVMLSLASPTGPVLFSLSPAITLSSMETATLLTAKDLHTGMGKMSGTYSNVKVLNSPAHVYSVSNPAKLVMSKLTIDNSAGDKPNSKSGGKAAGHNTDGFDVSTTDLTIEDSTVYNQDDCIAINKGSNIIFQRNTCSGGHGISIGSVSAGATVKNIQILNNKVVNNDQALRIKTKADATNASVTNVVFNGNTATGIKKYGVIVDQSYPSTLGTPGNKVAMSGISFGTNNIAVTSDAQRVAVDCGAGCTGSWDWSGLKVTGGKAGKVYNYKNIKAGSY